MTRVSTWWKVGANLSFNFWYLIIMDFFFFCITLNF